jgi:UDP-2,3-diacylglucosamine pyrophosphatase LpxH
MTTCSAAQISWLHLSDFHFREKVAWSQDVVTKSLLDDVRARYVGANAPNLLFLTGDIAFSGKREEYILAESFVAEIREALKLTPERIFVVPGNHDIDLEREIDAFTGARALLKNPEEVDRFFAKDGRRKTLFSRQEEYRAFANRISPADSRIFTPSSYAHHRCIWVGPIRVRVLLLDSAWLAQGGTTDSGCLVLGERQIIDCVAGASNPGCLTFALLHHPFSWLAEFEQVSVENLLLDNADICLRGHVHSSDMRAIDRSEARLATFTAGAAFTKRTADNTYSWCSLNLQTGIGEHVIHRYNHVAGRWDASERQYWRPLTAPPSAKDGAAVRNDLISAGARWPSFCACLLTGQKSEVPVKFPGHRVEFINFEARIPGIQNKAGDLVVRLRHHFFWRATWDSMHWEHELQSLISQLEAVFKELSQIGNLDIGSHEMRSQSIIGSVAHEQDFTAGTEIQALIRENAISRAHLVIDRWRNSHLLSPVETLEIDRLEILALLTEGIAESALNKADVLLTKPERTSGDIALAARCAFDAKQFERAAKLMHTALDAGFAVDEARAIALKISGAAGDKDLTQRVMK